VKSGGLGLIGFDDITTGWTIKWDTAIDLIARANDDGTGQRQYRECDESNNELRRSCGCSVEADCPFFHYCATNGVCTG
jgi:hypothetical protein